ncbi:hypothetical protein [uncultured Kordia sp.]|uniref:hypothetical protein n=1 Tax=uncultured Kordia sp. TaxID=507699 RepID=UPI0026075665|nr:hypothetical protein [uncultured Kordia sp.]
MYNLDIPNSLHFYTYYEHSYSLKLAADENSNMFSSIATQPLTENNRLKGIGLFNASMLLYAVSVELILKARALFEEKDRIKNGEIKNLKDFLKTWKGDSNGHDFFQIIKYYKIDVSEEHHNIFLELKEYAQWAGRFPFSLKYNDTKQLGSNNRSPGGLKQIYNKKINEFIESQKIIMGI